MARKKNSLYTFNVMYKLLQIVCDIIITRKYKKLTEGSHKIYFSILF